jgi:hypothetical protein
MPGQRRPIPIAETTGNVFSKVTRALTTNASLDADEQAAPVPVHRANDQVVNARW